MKLISISRDVLINPSEITAIETRNMKEGSSYYVILGTRTYRIDIDIQEFLKLSQEAVEFPNHHFAG